MERESEIKEKPFVSRAERNKKSNKQSKNKIPVKTVVLRSLLSLFTVLICVLVFVFTSLLVVINGECTPLRDKLVLSAMQASATKWLPGLFLPKDEVDRIVESSYVVNTDVISLDDYIASLGGGTEKDEDAWSNAKDGMLFETVKKSNFTGYVLLVKDPSRLFVGTSSDFTRDVMGMTIFDMTAKEDAIAATNAGEFDDPGGMGKGSHPLGVTFSKGKCVWNDSYKRTFIGFDNQNKLIVTEPMTKAQAEEMGIRDGVSFQNGNTLITNSDGEIIIYYSDKNTGTAQRTAIGQRADGTVILLVTDGRSASSLGATKNDVIEVMVEYGAISAGMLDGGSSSLMYYENYFDKYGYNKENLDQYQQKGLVNKYKAFTTPRYMPTYFCVARENVTDSEVQK